MRLEDVGQRQGDRPEDERQQAALVAAQDAPLLAGGGAEGAQVAAKVREAHSRRARPVREMNTSSSEIGRTWMLRTSADSSRAASITSGTRSRADPQWTVRWSDPSSRVRCVTSPARCTWPTSAASADSGAVTSRRTTSVAFRPRLRPSGVSSATMRPWSTIAIRSQSWSASSM